MGACNRQNPCANGQSLDDFCVDMADAQNVPPNYRPRHAWHSSESKQPRQRIILFFEESKSWLFFLSACWVCVTLIDWLIVSMSHWVCTVHRTQPYCIHLRHEQRIFALMLFELEAGELDVAHLFESIQSFRNETRKVNSAGVDLMPFVRKQHYLIHIAISIFLPLNYGRLSLELHTTEQSALWPRTIVFPFTPHFPFNDAISRVPDGNERLHKN